MLTLPRPPNHHRPTSAHITAQHNRPHPRPHMRGRSPVVSKAAVARKASEERRQRQREEHARAKTEARAIRARVARATEEEQRASCSRQAAAARLPNPHTRRSCSPPSDRTPTPVSVHPPLVAPPNLISPVPSLQSEAHPDFDLYTPPDPDTLSIQDAMHFAYAADDFHRAKRLLCQLRYAAALSISTSNPPCLRALSPGAGAGQEFSEEVDRTARAYSPPREDVAQVVDADFAPYFVPIPLTLEPEDEARLRDAALRERWFTSVRRASEEAAHARVTLERRKKEEEKRQERRRRRSSGKSKGKAAESRSRAQVFSPPARPVCESRPVTIDDVLASMRGALFGTEPAPAVPLETPTGRPAKSRSHTGSRTPSDPKPRLLASLLYPPAAEGVCERPQRPRAPPRKNSDQSESSASSCAACASSAATSSATGASWFAFGSSSVSSVGTSPARSTVSWLSSKKESPKPTPAQLQPTLRHSCVRRTPERVDLGQCPLTFVSAEPPLEPEPSQGAVQSKSRIREIGGVFQTALALARGLHTVAAAGVAFSVSAHAPAADYSAEPFIYARAPPEHRLVKRSSRRSGYRASPADVALLTSVSHISVDEPVSVVDVPLTFSPSPPLFSLGTSSDSDEEDDYDEYCAVVERDVLPVVSFNADDCVPRGPVARWRIVAHPRELRLRALANAGLRLSCPVPERIMAVGYDAVGPSALAREVRCDGRECD